MFQGSSFHPSWSCDIITGKLGVQFHAWALNSESFPIPLNQPASAFCMAWNCLISEDLGSELSFWPHLLILSLHLLIPSLPLNFPFFFLNPINDHLPPIFFFSSLTSFLLLMFPWVLKSSVHYLSPLFTGILRIPCPLTFSPLTVLSSPCLSPTPPYFFLPGPWRKSHFWAECC